MRELKKCSFEWENKIPKEWMEVRLDKSAMMTKL